MPRGPGGTYTLPAGNPVVPGTIIESDWANPTMADIGQEVSDSLSRSGKGGMLAALRGLDGSAAVPTFSFTNEPSSGRYRAGPGQVVESILGQPVVRYLATGIEQWNGLAWEPLTPRDALGTPFDPGPSNLTSTNVQDAIEEVNAKTGGVITADAVSYNDSAVYFPAATVQQAIDRLGTDVPALAQDILDNADAISINEINIGLNEGRIQQNEINIGSNTNDIALLDTRVGNNESNISSLQGDVSSIQSEQIVQNSNISQNTSDIAFTYNITQTNATNISQNSNDIAQNVSDIAFNRTDIDAILGVFPGGVLQVINGGTGTTTSTGTGNNVLSDSPTLSAPTMTGTAIMTGAAEATLKPPLGDRSDRIANTIWVQEELDDINIDGLEYGSNGNGYWVIFRRRSGLSVMIQWNNASVPVSTHRVTFPRSFGATESLKFQATVRNSSLGEPGSDWAVTNRFYNVAYVDVRAPWDFDWIAIGTA